MTYFSNNIKLISGFYHFYKCLSPEDVAKVGLKGQHKLEVYGTAQPTNAV